MVGKRRVFALVNGIVALAATSCYYVAPIGRSVIGLDAGTAQDTERRSAAVGPVAASPGTQDLFGSGIGGSPIGLSGGNARTLFDVYSAE